MPVSVCSRTDCDRPHHARGLCRAHYQMWVRRSEIRPVGERGAGRPRVNARFCAAPECTREATSKTYCNTHYQQWRKSGPSGLKPIRPYHKGE